jgi:hypothetical protein
MMIFNDNAYLSMFVPASSCLVLKPIRAELALTRLAQAATSSRPETKKILFENWPEICEQSNEFFICQASRFLANLLYFH